MSLLLPQARACSYLKLGLVEANTLLDIMITHENGIAITIKMYFLDFQ
jgi:hypothetical protein